MPRVRHPRNVIWQTTITHEYLRMPFFKTGNSKISKLAIFSRLPLKAQIAFGCENLRSQPCSPVSHYRKLIRVSLNGICNISSKYCNEKLLGYFTPFTPMTCALPLICNLRDSPRFNLFFISNTTAHKTLSSRSVLPNKMSTKLGTHQFG